MCAVYDLDPEFTDSELLDLQHEMLLDALREWARAGEPLRPTGRNARNLNPLLVRRRGEPKLQEAWWGHLSDGRPAPYPSINTRSERLRDRPADMRFRAIVPATGWSELQKPGRVRHRYALDDGALFGMAATIQRGRTADGADVTCYSVITRDAPEHLAGVHPRVPLLVPAAFAGEWMSASASPALVDDALAASEGMLARIDATAQG